MQIKVNCHICRRKNIIYSANSHMSTQHFSREISPQDLRVDQSSGFHDTPKKLLASQSALMATPPTEETLKAMPRYSWERSREFERTRVPHEWARFGQDVEYLKYELQLASKRKMPVFNYDMPLMGNAFAKAKSATKLTAKRSNHKTKQFSKTKNPDRTKSNVTRSSWGRDKVLEKDFSDVKVVDNVKRQLLNSGSKMETGDKRKRSILKKGKTATEKERLRESQLELGSEEKVGRSKEDENNRKGTAGYEERKLEFRKLKTRPPQQLKPKELDDLSLKKQRHAEPYNNQNITYKSPEHYRDDLYESQSKRERAYDNTKDIIGDYTLTGIYNRADRYSNGEQRARTEYDRKLYGPSSLGYELEDKFQSKFPRTRYEDKSDAYDRVKSSYGGDRLYNYGRVEPFRHEATMDYGRRDLGIEGIDYSRAGEYTFLPNEDKKDKIKEYDKIPRESKYDDIEAYNRFRHNEYENGPYEIKKDSLEEAEELLRNYERAKPRREYGRAKSVDKKCYKNSIEKDTRRESIERLTSPKIVNTDWLRDMPEFKKLERKLGTKKALLLCEQYDKHCWKCFGKDLLLAPYNLKSKGKTIAK